MTIHNPIEFILNFKPLGTPILRIPAAKRLMLSNSGPGKLLRKLQGGSFYNKVDDNFVVRDFDLSDYDVFTSCDCQPAVNVWRWSDTGIKYGLYEEGVPVNMATTMVKVVGSQCCSAVIFSGGGKYYLRPDSGSGLLDMDGIQARDNLINEQHVSDEETLVIFANGVKDNHMKFKIFELDLDSNKYSQRFVEISTGSDKYEFEIQEVFSAGNNNGQIICNLGFKLAVVNVLSEKLIVESSFTAKSGMNLSVSLDSGLCAVVSGKYLSLLELSTLRALRTIELENEAYSFNKIAISPDGKWIAISYAARIHSVLTSVIDIRETGKLSSICRIRTKENYTIEELSFAPENDYLVANFGYGLIVWDINKQEQVLSRQANRGKMKFRWHHYYGYSYRFASLDGAWVEIFKL